MQICLINVSFLEIKDVLFFFFLSFKANLFM